MIDHKSIFDGFFTVFMYLTFEIAAVAATTTTKGDIYDGILMMFSYTHHALK